MQDMTFVEIGLSYHFCLHRGIYKDDCGNNSTSEEEGPQSGTEDVLWDMNESKTVIMMHGVLETSPWLKLST